jgi:uncharacterized Tic20 family protein
MIEQAPTSSDRVAAILTHIGGIFFSFIPALIVYLAATENPWLKENARYALNFQLTMIAAWIISLVLAIVLIGFLLMWLIGIAVFVVSIVAAVKANQGQAWPYPMTIDLIK